MNEKYADHFYEWIHLSKWHQFYIKLERLFY